MMGSMMSRPNFLNLTIPEVALHPDKKGVMKISRSKLKLSSIDQKCSYGVYDLKSRKEISVKELDEIHPVSVNSIKLLTYNVWFESSNEQNRILAIMDIIKKSSANIVCLQQVNKAFRQAIFKNSEYLCDKDQFYMPIVLMHWYDTMILTRFPCRFYKVSFEQSMMSRSLLIGLFNVLSTQGKQLTMSINCVHLQSLQNQHIRVKQLQYISEVNKNIDLVCLTGDLNFSDGWKEDQIIQKQYMDLWKYSKKTKNMANWTMPPTSRYPQWRPDHILLRMKNVENDKLAEAMPFEIARIGDFTIKPYQKQQVLDIEKDGIVRTPSDHIGLLANFKI